MPPGFVGLKDFSINLKVLSIWEPGEILKFDICPWPEYFVLADFWFTYIEISRAMVEFQASRNRNYCGEHQTKEVWCSPTSSLPLAEDFFFFFSFFAAKVAPSEKITPAAPRCHSCEGVIRLWILSKVLKHFDKRHHKMVRSSSCPSPRPCILPRGRFSSVFNSPGVWEERTGRWKLERNMARK